MNDDYMLALRILRQSYPNEQRDTMEGISYFASLMRAEADGDREYIRRTLGEFVDFYKSVLDRLAEGTDVER